MRNLKSAFACAICKKEFYNPSLLIKHVEVRHPNLSRQFSTIKKEFLSHFCLSLQQEETRSPRFKYQVYLVNY